MSTMNTGKGPNEVSDAQRPALPGQTFDPGTVKAPRAGSSNLIVFGLVLGVSAGALFTMRQLGIKSGFTFQEAVAVEYQPPDPSKAATYERIMQDLAEAQRPLDVAMGELGLSAFAIAQAPAPGAAAVAPALTPEERAAQDAARRAEVRRLELEATARSLAVQSIIGGRVPVARINNRTVRVGDRLADNFTVKSIDDRSVVIEADGMTFTLEMAEQQRRPGGRR